MNRKKTNRPIHVKFIQRPPCILGCCLLLALWCVSAFPQTAKAQQYISIDRYSEEKFALALFPLYDRSKQKDGKTGALIEDRLKWTMDFSGLFRQIDRGAFLEKAETSSWTKDKTNFENWMILDALGLIKGWYKKSDKQLELELRLYDVFLQKELLKKTYNGPLRSTKSMVDDFANDMLRVLTGIKGVFGSKIAFVRRVKSPPGKRAEKELFVVALDGDKLQQLSKTRTPTFSPCWDRQGNRILMTSYPRRGQPSPYLLTLGAKNRLNRIGRTSYLSNSPRFSPVNDQIAISLSRDGNEELYLMNISGGLIRRLTYNKAIDVSPSWSPDGKILAFSSNRSGNIHIYKLPLAGRKAERLTFRGRNNATPAWSPRGTLIAFSGQDTDGKFDIFTMRPDGSDMTRLTWDSGDNEEPWFSPDGQHIVFSSERRGRKEIWLMRSDGSHQRPLTAKGINGQMPSWGPRRNLLKKGTK